MLSLEFRPLTAQGVYDAGIDKLAAICRWPSLGFITKYSFLGCSPSSANPAGVDQSRSIVPRLTDDRSRQKLPLSEPFKPIKVLN